MTCKIPEFKIVLMWMENVTWEGNCVNSCCRSGKTEKYNGYEGRESTQRGYSAGIQPVSSGFCY